MESVERKASGRIASKGSDMVILDNKLQFKFPKNVKIPAVFADVDIFYTLGKPTGDSAKKQVLQGSRIVVKK